MPGEGEEPEVTETGYVAMTKGPASDTESYYKATPAPGVRFEGREPPPSTVTARETSDRLPMRAKEKRGSGRSSGDGGGSGFPWMWVIGGVGMLGFFGLLTGAVVIYALLSGPSTEESAPEDEKTWEGLKVKKGLR